MEILSMLNVKIEILFAIIGTVETIKTMIEKRQISIYVLIALGISMLVSFGMTNPFEWQPFLLNLLVYFGLTSFLYKAVLRLVQKYIQKIEEQIVKENV